MKKLTCIIFSLIFILSSCGKEDTLSISTIEKKPFFIETRSPGKKTESFTIEKSARLTAGSSLTLSAESVGEVSNIALKEGDKIKRGTRLISLRDTVSSYDIRVAQAQNSVSLQDANMASTRVNLDRAVVDSQIAYEQAKRTYDTLISKTSLSYDTIVNTNQKTLDTLDAIYKTYLAEIEKNMDQVLYQSDQILGISTVFENTNNNFEAQLGARIGSLKVESDNSWGRASAMLADIRAKKLKLLSPETAQSDVEMIVSAYALIIKHIDDMIYMLQNNVISGSLSQEQNNAWLAIYSGYRSSVNGSNSAFTAWKNQILIFLKNYKLNELATKVAIESLDRDLTPAELAIIDKSPDAKLLYNTTIIDIKDRIVGARLSLKQAENARDTAIKSRDATLTQLGISRQSGVLSLEQAQREYAKLTIVAPFDGTISKVIATPGQRVNPGTPMIEVVSNTPEILIDLDAEIIASLHSGDSVSISIDKKTFTGMITAMSRTAGSNLLYTTRIAIPDAVKYIGNAATITFQGARDIVGGEALKNIILPLRSVKIISEQEGEITLLGSGDTIVYASVHLGKIAGDGVYIENLLDPKSEVILSDVSNFDPLKHTLQKEEKKDMTSQK